MNLQDLFSMIENKISSGECIKNSIDLINMYNSIDYKKYVKKNENKYNRTVVFSNKKIELVIITWCNGQSSGYHGHPGECIFKVLENSILEEKLRDHDYKERIYNVGDVGYIDNSIGIHNMIAKSDTVTLHIYSPPF
jgi:hypothetical protein